VDIVTVLRDSSLYLLQRKCSLKFLMIKLTLGREGFKVEDLWGSIQTQLTELIDTLNSTFPHFVRCMKPNDEASQQVQIVPYAGPAQICWSLRGNVSVSWVSREKTV
jgi:hypothetical protein